MRLYRRIQLTLRRFEDPGARSYYYGFARTHFLHHRDEVDKERAQELVEHGQRSLEWIKAKYGLDLVESKK